MNAPRQVDEEARRRSEVATQQLMRKYEGGSSVGVKLMAKMGYGAAGICSKQAATWCAVIYHSSCTLLWSECVLLVTATAQNRLGKGYWMVA